MGRSAKTKEEKRELMRVANAAACRDRRRRANAGDGAVGADQTAANAATISHRAGGRSFVSDLEGLQGEEAAEVAPPVLDLAVPAPALDEII